MSRDDFNRDMDGYLKSRRVTQRSNPLVAARNFFSKAFSFGSKKQEPAEELPLDIPQEQVEAVLAGGTIPRTGGARKAPTQSTTRPQAAQKTQERSTMGWFTKKKEQDEDYDMADMAPAQPVLDEEVKEVLKITFKWLKMMDAETVEEIKSSPDFDKYKAVLGKYGLIKK